MCDVESWFFAYRTKWNIFKTKQQNKKLSKKLLYTVFNDLSN
jgi:hypothetical protein